MRTIAFFDGLSLAITEMEVWQNGFFDQSIFSYQDMMKEIEKLVEQKKIVRKGAFVALTDHKEYADERIQRGMMSEEKYTKLRRAVSVLRYIPFIRMVGVCNTLAFDSARKEGDIDLLLVGKKNRLFITYTLSVALLHFLGLRRHSLHIQNRMCLSFYVSEDGLDMSRFELLGGDPYLAQWTKSVIPLFVFGTIAEKFRKANADWLVKYFGKRNMMKPVSRFRIIDSWFSRSVRKTGELMLFLFAPLLEYLFRILQQQRRIASSSKRLRNEPTGVIVDRRTLKFHEEDRRAFYREHMNFHV